MAFPIKAGLCGRRGQSGLKLNTLLDLTKGLHGTQDYEPPNTRGLPA